MIFSEYHKRTRCQGRAIRDAELLRERRIIREEPPADVHGGPADVEQFDVVLERQRRAAENFVEDHAADGRETAIGSGRAEPRRAGAIAAGGRVAHQREAESIGRHRPRRAIAVADGDDFSRHRMADRNRFAVVVELVGVVTVHDHTGMARGEHAWVARDQERRARRERRAVGEAEGDALGEKQSAEIQGERPDVLQLDEFKLVSVDHPVARRIVHHLVEDEIGAELADGVAGAGAEFNGERPLAPATGVVLVAHPRAIEAVGLHGKFGHRVKAVERRQLGRSPRRIPFEAELRGVGHHRVRQQHLGDAPLHRAERARALRIGKRGGLEDQSVHGIPVRADVGDRRACRDGGIQRLRVENRHPPARADRVAVDPPAVRAAGEHEVLHVLLIGRQAAGNAR